MTGFFLQPVMNLGKYYFSDLDTLIDGLHALFAILETQNISGDSVTIETILQAKLAIHEWMANLVQHANFRDREPEIALSIAQDGDRLQCSIEDNSEGFELDTFLQQHKALSPMPDRGMGLLMIQAWAEDLSYTRLSDKQRLTFFITGDPDSHLTIPFHG